MPDKQPPRRSRLLRWLSWGAVLLVVLALVGIAGTLGLIYGEQRYAGHIYPNISVRGFDLGYYDATSSRAALQAHYTNFLQQPVELVYHNQVWRPTAAQLGMSIELDSTLRDALALGRGDTRIESARMVLALWQQGAEVPLRITFDQPTMQNYLLQIADEIEQVPHNADVRINGTEIAVLPEQWGRQMLVDETLHDLMNRLQSLTPQRIAIRTRALEPPLRDTRAAEVAAETRAMFAEPLVLDTNIVQCNPACHWEWSPATLATLIELRHITRANGQPDIEPGLKHEALEQQVDIIAEAVERQGALPRVAWNGGNLYITQSGTTGIGLNREQFYARITTAMQGGPRSITLPLTEISPPVIGANLDSLGITAPLGVGMSSFRASEGYRITNIRAGARRMSGILIPPGGSFSFNDVLGPVNGSSGFVQGYAIVQNRTQKEWGGGLCQVSTTMFRAAFWAGLPITERHGHSFRIGWYEELGEPPGLDASIFTGVTDLQFTNDTDGWMLTEAYVDLNRQQLIIILYGNPDYQRQVAMNHSILNRTPPISKPMYVDDPTLPRGTVRQTDWARGGLHVQVYRSVYGNGQLLHQDTFSTIFEPWPDIYLRGTGGR